MPEEPVGLLEFFAVGEQLGEGPVEVDLVAGVAPGLGLEVADHVHIVHPVAGVLRHAAGPGLFELVVGHGQPDFFIDRLLGVAEELEGDEPLMKEILSKFREDLAARFGGLRQAVLEKDAAQVQRQAHSIKGSAATVRAKALQRAAGRMELAGGEGRWPETGSLLGKMEEERKTLERILEGYLRGIPGRTA